MRADWDVIVIGAGLAGLAAGATAARAGSATLVLEAHLPGGRARVTTKDGFVFNRGIHALYQGGAEREVLRSRRRVRRWPGRGGHEQRSAGRTVGDHRGRPPGGSPQAAAR
jgi:flavin-dependent dehydrogenase